MRTWNLLLRIDPDSRTPVYLQIVHGVSEAVRAKRLKEGDVLPGARTLADTLGVNRKTVLAAYQELALEGLVETRQGGGSFIRADRRGSAEAGPRRAPAGGLGYALDAPVQPKPALHPREVLACATGIPDLRQLPMAALSQAYHRAMMAGGQAALREGDPQGHPKLRQALASMLASTRALPASPETLLITGGDQMALTLVAELLFSPGEPVAVESMGDPQVWGAFRHAGAELISVPVDDRGLQVEVLERLPELPRLRAVLVTPQRQYPTTVSLSADRRSRLLELARFHRFAIIEHDVDSELQFGSAPALPLASSDAAGSVIHVGTLSKIFAPGVRLGFVHAPEPLISRLVYRRQFLDRRGDQVLELAMANLIQDGEMVRHLNRLRRLCEERRDGICSSLRAAFGEELLMDPPAGGMALWMRTPGFEDGAWAREAMARQVVISPSRLFALSGTSVGGARLGFAAHEPSELEEIARRLHEARRALP